MPVSPHVSQKSSLMPWAFGLRQPWYLALLIVALIAMLIVAVRRISRISDAVHRK